MKPIMALILALSLFNGKDLAGWKLRDPKADPTWKIVSSVKVDPANSKKLVGEGNGGSADSVLLRIAAQNATDLISEKSYGDCEIHLEFFLAKESNSGVFVMGQYEVQNTDSFGIPDNKVQAGECGGIPWLKPPATNACKPPGQWQTLDIVFIAPKFDAAGKKTANARFVSIALNGKKVQENLEVPEPTGAELEGGEKPTGPLMIQGNEGVVAFRNIRITAATGN
jgi:hypothetical protein